MVTTRLSTADDLFRLGPDARHELIEGELIGMSPQGRVHGRAISNLAFFLTQQIRADQSGELLSGDVGFILSRDPDTVLAPDIAFVRAARLLNAGDGYLELAPDLAVEIISPGNSSAEIERKISIYLESGSDEVWVVNPRKREVAVHRGQGMVVVLRVDDKLESPIFSNLSLRISEIF